MLALNGKHAEVEQTRSRPHAVKHVGASCWLRWPGSLAVAVRSRHRSGMLTLKGKHAEVEQTRSRPHAVKHVGASCLTTLAWLPCGRSSVAPSGWHACPQRQACGSRANAVQTPRRETRRRILSGYAGLAPLRSQFGRAIGVACLPSKASMRKSSNRGPGPTP